MRKDKFGSPQDRTKEAAKKSQRSTANCCRGRTDSAGDINPFEERREEEQEVQQPGIIEDTEQESEGESQVIRGDNLPIVDLNAYNTEGKEAQLIRINQVIEKVTGD